MAKAHRTKRPARAVCSQLPRTHAERLTQWGSKKLRVLENISICAGGTGTQSAAWANRNDWDVPPCFVNSGNRMAEQRVDDVSGQTGPIAPQRYNETRHLTLVGNGYRSPDLMREVDMSITQLIRRQRYVRPLCDI